MSIAERFKSLSKKEKIVISSIAAVVVLAIAAVVFIIANNKYLATTMRLLRVEGTVTIEDSTGSSKPVIDNIRFQSGDALCTGSDGLASVGLDDTKIVTLESDSRVEFVKHDKQIELNLTQGALFFEVTEKLADDEKYEIKTSNMTVGIRGTSGYVYYSDDGLQSLIITDGVVKVTGYNPKTNETKTVEVRGGEKVTAYLYDESTKERDSIEFEVKEVSEDELPEFPLQMLAENEDLLNKVCEETGWDKEKLLEVLNDAENTLVAAATFTATDTPTPTATAKPTTTIPPVPTVTTTPSPSPSTKPLATTIPTVTPSATQSPVSTTSPTPTVTPTTTVKPTVTPTVTTTPTATPTTKPTTTPTATPTATPTVATYTVKFITNGKCTAPDTQTVTEGSKAERPPIPTAEGYTFGGWYKDSACTNAYNFNSEVTSNIVLYAKWTLNTYTVTFDTDGLGRVPASQTVDHGENATMPSDPMAVGYTFTGWYTNDDCTEEFDFDQPITSDITIYAGWSRITYTVSFYTDGLGTAPSSQTVAHGDTVSVPSDPSEVGYTFEGWYTNDDCTEEYDFDLPVTEDITLYAGWSLNSYTVTFDSNGQGSDPDSQTVYYGDMVSPPDSPTAVGYTFNGWYTTSGCTEAYDFDLPVTGDITLYADWTLNTYTVMFVANGQGTAPASQTINHGDKATKPADPSVTGYTFGGWYTDSACTVSYDFDSAVTSDIELFAKWTINSYTVTFNANGQGSAPASQTVNYGSKATKPANPNATGYTFGGWYANSACTVSYDFNSAVTSNVTLYAKWTINSYTVTFNANGHGAAPSSKTVNYGSTVSKPTDPSADGFIFSGWYTDSACTSAYNFNLPVTDNITLYAKWSEPTPPAGYTKDTMGVAPWGETYDGRIVYVCYNPSITTLDGYYMGWLNNQWVNLTTNSSNSNGYSTDNYYYNGSLYCSKTYFTGLY